MSSTKSTKVSVFSTQALKHDIQYHTLAKQFKHYKQTADNQKLFGRDVLYERPKSASLAQLHHVHIISLDQWKDGSPAFNQTTDEKHLVYTQGFTDPNTYLLIAILSPNAHAKATNQFILDAIDIAERFRSQF